MLLPCIKFQVTELWIMLGVLGLLAEAIRPLKDRKSNANARTARTDRLFRTSFVMFLPRCKDLSTTFEIWSWNINSLATNGTNFKICIGTEHLVCRNTFFI